MTSMSRGETSLLVMKEGVGTYLGKIDQHDCVLSHIFMLGIPRVMKVVDNGCGRIINADGFVEKTTLRRQMSITGLWMERETSTGDLCTL